MPDPSSYDLNRANWDERAPLHLASREYAVQSFVDDPGRLSDVVTFDRDRLGDLHGLKAVHLQCHIGTDTISLGRLGADVTGLDFSAAAIAGARDLAARANSRAVFVEASVDDAVSALGEGRFDLVYTGIGALCWLPDITAWARTVSSLLAPGGRLFIREGHPVLWAIDEEQTSGLVLGYPYFEQPEPLVWDDSTTYVETDESIKASVTHEWNHGIGEILTAVLEAGLTITQFVEHTSVPWEALPGRMHLDDDGEWMLSEHAERLPLTYTLQAVKTA
ncbi:class I SAM-dependent methyltransferase [Microbacterium saperdae]|uniref:Methyltransferase family protein n=1 Tax=Microbacterium saperdae TaxID=69368 RepID=A0A543BA78_9MICO|nr:class I SAM-dependent methyltransferase [Microbacterium saperdae]TQL81755.1 methyltransferase family protein [Microbacterium saperdae]GGM34575.1 methyltransferase [Microbacterium saperdae]